MTAQDRSIGLSIDVSRLPTMAFGSRDIMWWGTMGFAVIEGMTLALCAATYLYLRRTATTWPPIGTPLPSLVIPTLNVLAMAVSVIPMRAASRAARRFDKTGVRWSLLATSLLGLIFLVLRWHEFHALHTRWDSHAYGSVTWAILGFHASLLVVEVGETIGSTLIFWTGPVEEKYFGDVVDNALYWYFMIGSWFVLYLLVYLIPRWV